jgi:hypothetical protein
MFSLSDSQAIVAKVPHRVGAPAHFDENCPTVATRDMARIHHTSLRIVKPYVELGVPALHSLEARVIFEAEERDYKILDPEEGDLVAAVVPGFVRILFLSCA